MCAVACRSKEFGPLSRLLGLCDYTPTSAVLPPQGAGTVPVPARSMKIVTHTFLSELPMGKRGAGCWRTCLRCDSMMQWLRVDSGPGEIVLCLYGPSSPS